MEKNFKFLIVAQDLRVSGTSEGVVSRSFISQLRKVYPEAVIDIIYIRNHQNDDRLDLLPVDCIKEYYVSNNLPNLIIWLNKIWWRIIGSSLNDAYRINKYKNIISKLKYDNYDHIFIRSSGQEYETIRATEGLPILKKSIINFHDPYPVFWDTGSNRYPRKIEFAQFKEVWKIVKQARACMSPSLLLSQDLSHLYGSNKRFHVIPHQYDAEVFEMNKRMELRKRKNVVNISYHGALQLGRNLEILIRAYINLINENSDISEKTEFTLRLRGSGIQNLKKKYCHPNITFLSPVELAISATEQQKESDILIILDNCANHSNILVGKAPLLASFKKPVFVLTPERSEIRRIIKFDRYYASCENIEEVQKKLGRLIKDCLENKVLEAPFGDYFGLNNFKNSVKGILDY
ncbi:hypothetical protein [Christiangramia salexigens]|uniref:Uncharacterized protein n=1 Tax=Christiangramia salexigens TaxID=1913577 RepID=A0A1L3J4N4_9FLAO|nr:hypothetical protein [Christiangramia salexigens]APG60109.1 hypothetical protein LPB144_06625 [Christiangramia salexigens]